MEQQSLEKDCNIKSLWMRSCCPASSTSSGSCSGFNSCNALSTPHIEALSLMRGLFREYFKSLFYKKPSDSVVDECQSERLLPRLSEMRLERGTKGWDPPAPGACMGSERPNHQGFILPARVSTLASVQDCILFLSA